MPRPNPFRVPRPAVWLLVSFVCCLMTPRSSAAVLPEAITPDDARLLGSSEEHTRAGVHVTIADMVAGVESDSIQAVLEKLTGEVPANFDWGSESIISRYYTSQGQDYAAEFLRNIFESYGYTVDFQYFGFPYVLESIVVGSGGAGISVGTKGRALRTDDTSVWDRAKGGIETVTGTVRNVDHVSGDEYVIVGNLGLIATTADAGLSWVTRTSSAAERLNGVDVRASGVGWIAGKNGVILTTTDAGATWQDQTSGVATFLYDVDSIDDATAVAVGAGGVIVRTTDAGSTWSPVASGSTTNLFRVDFVGNLGWVVGGGGTILATTDQGATWSAQTSGVSIALNDVSFADGSHGWAVGAGGTILRSTDGGTSWSDQSLGVGAHKGVSASSSTEAWIVGLNGLLRTTDQGANWEDRTTTVRDGWVNVVATQAGTTMPGEEVLLVGHYDSISQLANPANGAPGADDNGTGIAVIVESARQLAQAQYERTIRFVCFSGEENGLLGSEAYAANAESQGDALHAVFNLDAVGWNDDYFRIFSISNSAWLGNVALSMAGTYAPGLLTFHWDCPSCDWSDHWSFWEHNFHAIVGIETWDPPPPQHHTTGDSLGLVDIPLVTEVTKIALSTIATVAVIDTTGGTGVEVLSSTPPSAFRLLSGEPNPTSTSTTIRFDVPTRAPVRLRIFDVAGRVVRVLEDGPRNAGRHAVTWDGRNRQNERVAAGVYLYRLESGSFRETRELTLLR